LAIPSKDEFFTRGKPRSEVIVFPELGEGVELRIRGWTFEEGFSIREASTLRSNDGKVQKFDDRNNVLLSVVAAVEEPALTVADITRIAEMGGGVIDHILAEGERLSGKTADAYADLKQALQQNPLVRRAFAVLRKHYHRFPSEVGPGVSSEEFMTALAEMELEAEELNAAAEEQES
jgi:hypothetical protein